MDLDFDIRADFPVLDDETLVYLDTAATSLTPHRVLHKMNDYYRKYSANVHRGVYRLSHEATELYNDARRTVARLINAEEDEVVFTRGASNALNMVARMLAPYIQEGDEIITSELEHHSHFLPWQRIAKERGAKLIFVPLDQNGRIQLQAFKNVLSPRTRVVALTHVSNVMGYLTPIEKITELAHAHGAYVSVDAAQSVPHMEVDVKRIDCDFLAFSAHKMLGPTGFGILYGKRKHLDAFEPVEFGGDMVGIAEKDTLTYQKPPLKFETGTPPIAEAIGFAEAIDYLEEKGLETIREHEKRLAEYAHKALSGLEDVVIYNKDADAGIITFNLKGVHPHDVVTVLDDDNIALRAGHHCAQLVMQWLSVAATLRASFYLYNTRDDIDRLIESLKRARDFFKDAGL